MGQHYESCLRDMIANSTLAFIVCDPKLDDNPIVMCNDAFLELTGYDKDEIIGHNCRFLRGKDTEPKQTQKIVKALSKHKPVLAQLTNYKRDGTPFFNAVMIAPMFDEVGKIAYYLGSQMEITEDASQARSKRQDLAVELVKLLSPQQKRVLEQVSKGYMNKEIAHILQISESTVKMHRAEAFSKINVSTTAEAIRVAIEAGL